MNGHNSAVKRWLGALSVVLLACMAIIAFHSRSPRLLEDSDTKVLLSRLAARHNALSWFSTDWPLNNHFYRPVTALSFELDRRLFVTAPGFGLSASFYCALCVLVLFWLCRELTDSPAFSASVALLFALWHSPFFVAWDQIAVGATFLVAALGVLRHRLRVRYYLPALLAITFAAAELGGVHLREAPQGFYLGVLTWLPSRTATLMTLFSLISIASYLRFERLGSPQIPKQPSPIDPPTTRSSSQADSVSRSFWIWFPISVVAAGLALGSYEQAAMLPFLLLLAAGVMRGKGYSVKWGSHVVFWVLLFIVVVLRDRVLPPGISDYQQQQLRHGWNAALSAVTYLAPAAVFAPSWWSDLSLGVAILEASSFYLFFWNLAGNAISYKAAFSKSGLGAYAWLSSVVAFLPMAFLKQFPHYHYLPMALRAIFVVILVRVVWDFITRAASPPSLQAPVRLAPAPGSLLHQ